MLTHPGGSVPSWQSIVETTDAANSVSGFANGYILEAGSTFSGYLSAGDTDVIAIDLIAGDNYVFALGASDTQSGSVQDTVLTLFSSDGTFVARNDDISQSAGNLYSELAFTAETSGRYYVSMTTYKTAYSDSYAQDDNGYYTLSTQTETQAQTDTVFTFDQIAQQLSYVGWNNQSYAWNVAAGQSLSVNTSALTASGQTLARHAMDAWTYVTGILFTETASGAQITFDDNNSGAYASFSILGNAITSASINVSTAWLSSYGTSLNSYSFQTYIHEVGHALGLAHAGNYNGSASYGVDNHYVNDSWQSSIMSYFNQTENTAVDASYAFVITPQIADILAAQTLYGTPGTIRTGDTTYGANSTAGGYLDQIATLTNTSFTVFDDGGTDTLDTSTATASQRINMSAEKFSDVFGETGNMAIARGTVLENVEGGTGEDWILGNSADNVINGNAGNDEIYARDGNDLVSGGAGNDRLVGNGGDDTLYGGDGDDILRGKSGSNTLYGDAGADQLRGSNSGADLLSGGAGADRLIGLSGMDSLYGGADADSLYGGGDGDLLEGGSGDDLLRGNTGDDTMAGGTGTDKLYGGTGNDTLTGGEDRDFLRGDAGNDVLDGGLGRDNLTGGAGADIFVFETGYGFDRVRDFQDGQDRFDVEATGANDVMDLLFETVGSNLRINFGSGDVIYIHNTDVSLFSNDDFIFV